MTISVTITGTLTRPSGKERFERDCAEGTTVAGFLTALGYDPRHIPHIIASVNGEIKRHDTPLKEGDDLLLTLQVGGG